MSDDGGTTTGDTSTLTISITPVNDAFADDDEIVSIAEDTQATGNVLDASPNPTGDGAVEVTTFAVDTNGDGTDESFNAGQTATIAGIGELTIAADGAYTFTPVADYNGPVPVATYSMSDDGGTTTGDTSTLTISVTPVNDAFADDDEIVSIAEDTQATGNVLDASPNPTGDGAVEVTTFAVDTNGDGTDESFNAGQTATIAGIGELTIGSDGAYTFEPSTHYSGPVPLVTYSMSDDGGTTTGDISTLDIKVIPVADTPTASISLDSATIAVGSRVDEQISTIIIGDATGDNNINGSINTDYSEDENVTVDFGSDYAGQTVSLQLDIEINGSWNYDGGSNNAQYFDDFWELLVDGVAKARFFYNANLNENSGQSTANSDNLLSGGDNIRFASPSTTNSNITEFKHTYDIDVVLDSNGKAELGFAAQTTEFGLNGETATITGVAVTNLETYTYKFDVSAALVDTDTSESLALQISGVPQGSAFVSLVSTNNFTLSDQGGGTWLLTGVQNATSLTDTLTLVVASVPGSPPQFDLSVQSIATESGNQDEAQSAISMLQINGTSVTSAPIALDLDDDGLEYLSLDAGVVFTDENSGESVNTAWVGADDGLLVIDANNSGTVDESKEYVFTEWSETAETDMEAVREVFDTNSNGMLDAGDEAWNQFAVWQDANSDGKTDEGELFSLGELGVESIALDYDALSEARTEADGDVIVHGQSQVTWSDGSTTTAEDTSFAISAAEVLSDGEDELFQEDGTSSQVTAQAPYPGEQVDAPASVAPSFEELDTSNNSIE
ncbi:MAG: cadherin-like domain-containing protein [Halomonas sp.]|uniref:cadherin-like domain-containing protein n=1 Tax=Halomonas sp. TaxID=1486246 RepID=UPI002ACDBA0C|nr:cadherin-like domain-containing protein [Halomonas sp.]MDZ7852686.1 cadherin-like domain-containing protein [Halomonas sp.]